MVAVKNLSVAIFSAIILCHEKNTKVWNLRNFKNLFELLLFYIQILFGVVIGQIKKYLKLKKTYSNFEFKNIH